MNNKYIWLFGENLGQTMNNNAYYAWEHIVEKYSDDDVRAFLVLEPSKENKKKVRKLSRTHRSYVLWRNSPKHQLYYKLADMFFVALSYKDILPDKSFTKTVDRKLIKPLVYLQHGTTAIKKLNYHRKSFNNNFYRLVYYNKLVKPEIIAKNGFKDYQFYYGQYHPRYKEMFKRAKTLKKEKQILWFLTWREYFGDNEETRQLVDDIKAVVSNEELIKYLKRSRTKFKILLHSFFEDAQINEIMQGIDCKYIEIVNASDVDVMDELVKSSLLITDYSSVGFEFTVLNKPVLMYQPDIKKYLEGRDIYCDTDELNKYNITSNNNLVKEIVKGKYKINGFFKKRLPRKIDPKYITEGKHIDKMYEYFLGNLQNKISFIGYNFYGQGGTVTATKSLSEGLLEKGYMVELLSLKRNYAPKGFPAALNYKAFYIEKSKKKRDMLKRRLFKSARHFGHINHDENKAYLIPYVGYALRQKLKNIKSGTVVSTRESLHMFLKEAKSPFLRNKIYYFHSPSTLVDKTYPGVMDILRNERLEKAAFVTEKDRLAYQTDHNYSGYNNYKVMGNCLESSNIITRDEVQGVRPKNKYKGIYLTRLSKDRIDDLNNLLEFGEYLKKNDIKSVEIDLFGAGDYAKEFVKRLEDKDLKDIIHYKGLTKDSSREIRKHDFLLDLSTNHSFGMIYVEGIMNGKMVFAKKNYGSAEVLAGCNKCFIKSWEDLADKITNLHTINTRQLVKYHDKLSEKYSRNAVSSNFVKLMNGRG